MHHRELIFPAKLNSYSCSIIFARFYQSFGARISSGPYFIVSILRQIIDLHGLCHIRAMNQKKTSLSHFISDFQLNRLTKENGFLSQL